MKTQSIGVSVVMPAYCAEKTIERAINSVLSQSYRELELIVIDDASTDTTYEIAKQYEDRDSRVHILQNKKQLGVSASRKKGITAAKYPLIAFLDSDDIWKTDKLALQVDVLMNDPDCAICFTASNFINDTGMSSAYILHAPNKVTYRELLQQNVISCSSVLVRKEDLLKYPMPDVDMIHEDYAVWLHLLHEYPYATGIDKPLLIYQVSATSKSGKKVKAAKMQWNTYRYCKVPLGRACVSFVIYAIRNVKKYMAINQQMTEEGSEHISEDLKSTNQFAAEQEVAECVAGNAREN